VSAQAVTWAVVQPADEFDNISVCAFEGDPANGIMADVIAEIVSIDDEKDARLIAAAPDLKGEAAEICAILDANTESDGETTFYNFEAIGEAVARRHESLTAVLRKATGAGQ
jgi:hypothetical protein